MEVFAGLGTTVLVAQGIHAIAEWMNCRKFENIVKKSEDCQV